MEKTDFTKVNIGHSVTSWTYGMGRIAEINTDISEVRVEFDSGKEYWYPCDGAFYNNAVHPDLFLTENFPNIVATFILSSNQELLNAAEENAVKEEDQLRALSYYRGFVKGAEWVTEKIKYEVKNAK